MRGYLATVGPARVRVGFRLQGMTDGNRIFLIGFSGTGKSAVGRSVARLLGWAFADADELIVERADKSIDRIFADDGEPAFRRLERDIIVEMATRERVVISTGAGSVDA